MAKLPNLSGVPDEDLLAEIEDVIRTMPSFSRDHIMLGFSEEEELWLARAAAAIESWSVAKGIEWQKAVNATRIGVGPAGTAGSDMRILLHQCRNTLRLRTTGPVNAAIGKGHVHDYFEELRRIISLAKTDVMFVDRYFDGAFVDRYFPHIDDNVPIRILTWSGKGTAKQRAGLKSAADLFAQQHGVSIEIRKHADVHDRYVIIDGSDAYHSSASFKHGPQDSGATIREQSGTALGLLLTEYSTLWDNATPE